MTDDLSDITILTPLAPSESVHVGTARFVARAISRGAEWLTVPGPYIHVGRCKLVSLALQTGRPFVFWLDSDVTPPPDCIERLREHQKDIVAAPYPILTVANEPQRRQLFWAISGKQRPYGFADLPGEVFEVESAGTGAMLVRVDVFRRLDFPWFDVRPVERSLFGVLETEDWFFCRRAREAGYSIFCDGTLRCDHQKTGSLAELYRAAADERVLMTVGRR